jgi:integrase
MLADFIPEQWPASNRNPWPTSVGIITHWTLAKARAEAQRLEGLRQQKRDPKLAVYNPTTAVTLGDVIDWYHDKHLTNPSTQANFTHLTKRLKADLGATPLRDFTRHVLKGWIEGRLTANNAGGLETLLRWLSSAFNQASDSLSGLDIPAGYENPAKGLGSKIPAIANRPRGSYAVSWEDDEWSHIMVAIETAYTNSPLSPLGVMVVEMIMVTGARPSEIATLRWDEIEDHKVKTGAVTLRMKKIIKDRHKTWKNTRRPRQILLGKRGIDILTRAKKYADDTGYTGQFVFPSPKNGNSSTHLKKPLHYAKEIGKLCGIELVAYNFRSAYINHALDELGRGKLEIVAENVGHENSATTLKYYTKNRDSDKATAAMAVDEAFDQYCPTLT